MKRAGRVLLMTPNLKGMTDGLNRIQPPLDPMIMAAVLRERGHAVFIHDTALAGWANRQELDARTVRIGSTDPQIAAVIERINPDIIAISALFSNLAESAHSIAAIAKRINSRIIVVLGGNHISNAVGDYLYALHTPDSGLPEQLVEMADSNIDFAVWGEADHAFPLLVDRLLNGGNLAVSLRSAQQPDEVGQFVHEVGQRLHPRQPCLELAHAV